MRRGLLAYVMVFLVTLMALVNFFAPFFFNYKTNPLITYYFLLLAGSIAGFKGVGSLFLKRMFSDPEKEKPERKEIE